MQSARNEVIRDAAAVVVAYVLGLRESSVMSLPTGNVTITNERMTMHLVLAKGRALRHATPAIYVRTGAAGLPSPIDLVQLWTVRRDSHPRLFGMIGDTPEWRDRQLIGSLYARVGGNITRTPAGHYLDVT
jgi:hypothetical protein